MMGNNIYPCRCGHYFEETHTIKSSDNRFPCWYNYEDEQKACLCWDFKLNNLKYLEQTYESRTK